MAKRKKNKNEITHVHKVPLILDEESARHLDGQSKITNKLYNILKESADRLRVNFAKAKEAGNEAQAREIGKVLYTERGLRDMIPDLKQEHKYLKLVHSSPLKNAALRLHRAIKAHQDTKYGRRTGPKVEWPRFRAWKKDWMSLEYEEFGKGWKLIDGTKLQISFGKNEKGQRLRITAVLEKPPAGIKNGKSLRIIKEYGRYFAIFTIVKPKRKPRKPRPERIAYIDPNSSNMGVSMDTQGMSILIENIAGIAELDRTIDKVKRRRDRKVKKQRKVEFIREDGSVHLHHEPSRKWKSHDKVLKKLENKRRERIKQVLYSHAHALFDLYDVIGFGNWAPANGDSGMGKKANRTLRSRRWIGTFRNILTWVALKRRKLFFVLDERGTTRTCSQCSYVNQDGIPPDVRQWNCPECHAVHDRDENAAQNGLKNLLFHLEQEHLFRPPAMPCSGLAVTRRCNWSSSPGAKRFGRGTGVDQRDRRFPACPDTIQGSPRMGSLSHRAEMPVSIPPGHDQV